LYVCEHVCMEMKDINEFTRLCVSVCVFHEITINDT